MEKVKTKNIEIIKSIKATKTIMDYFNNPMSGFEVITSKQNIKLLMDEWDERYHNHGYFWCNDNLECFIDAKLKDIIIAHKPISEKQMKKNNVGNFHKRYNDDGIMFVNIGTDRGILQFVAYNKNYNGFSGSKVKIISKQIKYSIEL